MSDASANGGFSVVPTRVITHSFPLSFDKRDMVETDWNDYRTERYMPIRSPGYGAGDAGSTPETVATN